MTFFMMMQASGIEPIVNKMTKHPLPITIIAWLFITAGVVGIAYHSTEINIYDLFGNELLLALFIRLLAVAGGVFTLRGANWARWLLLVWIAYHVCLSFFHDLSQVITHVIIMTATAYVLFRPAASAYFRKLNQSSASGNEK